MSHVKNVECYSRLVDICTGYGGKYNPGHQSLQLKAMRALLQEAQSSLHDVTHKQDAYERKQNERSEAFAGLEVLATRVINIMGASQMSKANMEDARFYHRLLAGVRATPVPPITTQEGESETVARRGFSQLSYVAKASNFYKLAQKAQELPGYNTNEPDLMAEALLEKAGTLHRLNKEVHEAKVNLIMSRQQRNQLLYRSKHGIVDNARAAKRYVRAAFGTRSEQANRLKDVSFTKLKIK